jgi:peptide/nickel transport system permease protein
LGLRDYILRRVVYTFLLLLLVVSLNFAIFRLAPSDPLTTIVAGSRLRPEQIEILKKRFHIGEPLSLQYIYYMSNLLQGEFGYSYRTQRPIASEIAEVLPNTLLLLGVATIISIIVGVALGIVAAARRGKLADISILFLGMTFYALPTFWIGLMLLLLFGFTLPIFPLRGTVSLPPPVDPISTIVDVLWHLTLPALTLILHLFAEYAVVTRNSLLGVLTEDYILTARAKGLDEKTILLRYALKNAALPMVTLIAIGFGGILGGAIIAETVFSWQGIGQYLWAAIEVSDYPVMQAVFFVIAVATIIANLAADVLYGFLDPRIKY